MVAVHKKEPADAKAMAGREEPVIVTDVIVEEVSVVQKSPDPLSHFKEEMTKEELPGSNMPPKKNFMWPIIFVFVIALLMLGGIFIYKQSASKNEDVNVVSLSPAPTVIPSPAPAEVDLSKYEIKVLNGSEVSGEAGRQKTNLEEEGFTVAETGNADNSDYTKTIIQAKADVDQAFLDKLKSVLEISFTLGDQEELPDDEDSDVIVILGSETN